MPIEFLSSVLIVRYLGMEDYGHYTALYLIPILFASLGSLGFGPSIVYYIGRENIDIRKYLLSFTLFGAILGFIIYVIFALLANYINLFIYDNRLDLNLFFISLLFIPIVIIQKYVRAILRGIYEVKLFSFLLDLAMPIIRVITVLLVIFLDFKLIGIVITPVIVQGIIALYIFFYLIKVSSYSDQFRLIDFTHFIDMSKFALKSFIGTFLQKSNSTIVNIISSSLLSFNELSILTLAQKLLSIISSVSNSLLTVLMPKVSKSSLSEIVKFIPKSTSILFIFNLLFLTFYLLIVEILVVSLYGPEFKDIAEISIPLGIATIFLPLCNILLLSITFTGDPIKKSYARGGGFAVNLLSLFYLYNLYGLLGLGISIALGQIVIFILSLIFFRMKFKDVNLINLFILKIDNLIELKKALSQKFDKKR